MLGKTIGCLKVASVECSAALGLGRSMTFVCRYNFHRTTAHPFGSYYGVCIAVWKNFFWSRWCRFSMADANGVNRFFVDPAAIGHGNFLFQTKNRWHSAETRLPVFELKTSVGNS